MLIDIDGGGGGGGGGGNVKYVVGFNISAQVSE